jgi:hypothetical protein
MAWVNENEGTELSEIPTLVLRSDTVKRELEIIADSNRPHIRVHAYKVLALRFSRFFCAPYLT